MRVVHEPPPKKIAKACLYKFGASYEDGVCFTYGDAVHSQYLLRPDVEAHERVHIEQQCSYGIIAWWDRYLCDDDFRLEQELEAYRAQWRFVQNSERDRNRQAIMLTQIAKDLASPMYGKLLPFKEALKAIKNEKK